MKLTNNIYANFDAVVTDLGAPDGVFYTESSPQVTGIWAIYLSADVIVICGGTGSNIVATATLLADYPAATLLSTNLSVT